MHKFTHLSVNILLINTPRCYCFVKMHMLFELIKATWVIFIPVFVSARQPGKMAFLYFFNFFPEY